MPIMKILSREFIYLRYYFELQFLQIFFSEFGSKVLSPGIYVFQLFRNNFLYVSIVI